MIKVKTSRKIFLLLNATGLVIFAFLCIVPFINLLAVSLSSSYAVDAGEVVLFPIGFSLDAYSYLLSRTEFFVAFGWSVLRVVFGTLLSLAIITLAAYPISKSKREFSGRGFYTAFFILIMFFNGGIIPTYIIMQRLGLLNTLGALIFPSAMNAWNMVLLVNFFRLVPAEMEEAASIEGAGYYRKLFLIVLPVSLPAIATVTVFTAVMHWNAWFDGQLYMNKDSLPLQSYIYNMINEMQELSRQPNLSAEERERLANVPGKTMRSAQIFIAMLPIMVIYPFAQKFFVKGLVMGSVKS